MENPFRKILQDEKLPEIIKDRVMDDVALVKLSLDLADLLAVKYPNSLEDILKITRRNKKNP